MRRRFRLGILGVKYAKGIVGLFLLLVALALTLYTGISYIRDFPSSPIDASIVLLSDVLLVLVMLELAKTVFSFLENDEAYLHSIMEASFIAVLREVILLEVRGISLEKGVVLAFLILAIGYVYYKMYEKTRTS